jgi:hypothetical protein
MAPSGSYYSSTATDDNASRYAVIFGAMQKMEQCTPTTTITGSSWCTLDGMLSTAFPTRKLLLKTVLDAIHKSAIAKQEYESAERAEIDRLALALRITKGAERAAVSVLDDHIRQHG